MSNINSKWFTRACLFCALALFAAGNAWAEPQVPPFDGVLAPIWDYLHRMWSFLAGLAG